MKGTSVLLKRIKRNREAIGCGLSLALLFFLLRWIELRFLIMGHSLEIYIGVIAFIFTVVGIWIAMKINTPKIRTVIIKTEKITERENFVLNENAIAEKKISRRELEVLGLIAKGMSNNEIAEALFVSLNTVKTHSSNLFEKLEVRRRTQAVEAAKKLGLLP